MQWVGESGDSESAPGGPGPWNSGALPLAAALCSVRHDDSENMKRSAGPGAAAGEPRAGRSGPARDSDSGRRHCTRRRRLGPGEISSIHWHVVLPSVPITGILSNQITASGITVTPLPVALGNAIVLPFKL